MAARAPDQLEDPGQSSRRRERAGSLLPPGRVVSVSPTDAEAGRSTAAGDTVRPALLTPRVLDQSAFDDLAGTLRSLLDEAEWVAGELAARVEEARTRDDDSTQAASRLQERLRLGARMLKAIQSQIDRAGVAARDLDERQTRIDATTARVEDLQSSLKDTVRDAVERGHGELDVLVDGARRRLEEEHARRAAAWPDAEKLATRIETLVARGLEQIEARRAAAAAAVASAQREALNTLGKAITQQGQREERDAARLFDLESRMGELAQVLETAEVTVAAMSHRITTTTDQAEAARDEAADAIRRCETQVASLEATREKLGDEVAGLEARGQSVRTELTAAVERGEAGVDDLQRGGAELGRLLEQFEMRRALGGELERLLERLAPWERLLLGNDEGDADGPGPVATAIDALRDGIGRDLARLATTMRDVAERVEQLGPARSSSTT